MTRLDCVESAGGRLGAVLSAPRSGVVALGRHGPWLTTTLVQAREVLTDVSRFDFPGDVSRSGDLSGSRADTRSGHTVFTPLSPDQVEVGARVFASEWRAALAQHDRDAPGMPYDAMALLRLPVARSTTAAVISSASAAQRDVVGDLVLDWIDALGPVIAARRPPLRWARARRREHVARRDLEDTLARTDGLAGSPAEVATMLAAGIQVPIAAGSWLLAWLAQHPSGDLNPAHAAWEAVRLTPPTWLLARVAREPVELGDNHLPAGAVVLVSPLLLGRQADLVPGEDETLTAFDPGRWSDDSRRPGGWLPFGAGPHACPGRTLGLALLVHLAQWGLAHEMTLRERVGVDQSRGIAPLHCRFTVAPRGRVDP